MSVFGQDSLKTRKKLKVGTKTYEYYSIKAAEKAGLGEFSKLPYSLKILLENLLRWEDGSTVTTKDIEAMSKWLKTKKSKTEIAYRPARVLMQDFTGVPAVVDLAAMRDAMAALGGNPKKINPLVPVDLVIDHSVMIDHYGSKTALKMNMDLEFERNQERYEFLRWGQDAFDNFRVVPPGTGICHQVNMENLAKVAWTRKDGKATVVYSDTCVGTDSHTTMINGLGVLGWGVGGIEAEAAMLGQPVTMLIPEVVGFKLTGKMKEGTTATDLVLTVTEMLRKVGVVGKFVEFFGPGLDNLSLPNRATISNMAPEYGATCGIFPIDAETIRFLKFSGRTKAQCDLVEAYAKAQGMWRTARTPDAEYTKVIELDVSTVEPSLAGPKRPQDRILLSAAKDTFDDQLPDLAGTKKLAGREAKVKGADYNLTDGDVVIASITSCTNTSNPNVLIAAGLVAEKAVKLGLQTKPWVKTSLAPGSLVVADYLKEAGLQKSLDKLGFNIAGYGCTTCIGNSGPLDKPISDAIEAKDLVATAVLSGNRNFEGRISPHVKANYLASPPLVVVYALSGSMVKDPYNDPIGKDKKGNPVYMKDVWPTNAEVEEAVAKALKPAMYKARNKTVFDGTPAWRKIKPAKSLTYTWDDKSTYVQNPPYFVGMDKEASGDITDVVNARPLAILGDSVTTDHISPAGSIKKDSPAGKYLTKNKVRELDFNSYGSRRGNHEVMMRGTFANIRIRNKMAPGTEGGVTKYMPKGEQMSIYDASMKYQKEGTQLVVIGGKEYGTGSSRDWAAKGTNLLGVKAVIAESFERIHRSNLVGMGVLPLQFTGSDSADSLKLTGKETFTITGIGKIKPRQKVQVEITDAKGKKKTITTLCRIDTADELTYFKSGGILSYVLRNLAA